MYNSEGTLPELVGRLEKVLSGVSSRFEVILVNDGSRESSFRTLTGLPRDDKNVKIITLARNLVQQLAVIACFDFA